LLQASCREKKVYASEKLHEHKKCKHFYISCDANYSNLRVGKQQMVGKCIRILETQKLFSLLNIKSVLDVRCARGHFIKAATRLFPNANIIIGLEEDPYLNTDKTFCRKIKILKESIYSYKSAKSFDFIFSCHTLEHYRDPFKYLTYIYQKLNPNGILLLDIPNILDFLKKNALDEAFYDKHLLYFEPYTIQNILEQCGLSILSISASKNGCIEILAQKSKSQSLGKTEKQFQTNFVTNKLIYKYAKELNSNRVSLPLLSRKIEQWLKKYKAPIAFGAGRILDAFEKYGKLDTKNFDVFVDNYLCDASKYVNGKLIYRLSEMNLIPDAAILFTREKSISIVRHIKLLFPKCLILHWSEFQD
jgi:2-polyprenyl-3-methyl-5-hydroxy-6-metoxy-1,4-benzoquinol methylase